jgi:hypothetical protein
MARTEYISPRTQSDPEEMKGKGITGLAIRRKKEHKKISENN